MAANGYPGVYVKNTEIRDLQKASAVDDVTVFHAGTKKAGDQLLSTGGRVLGVTATGKTVSAAKDKAYDAVTRIDWPEGFCRSDIGWRAVAREKQKK